MNIKYGDEASFFKILSSDSDDYFTLPCAFAEKYLEKSNNNNNNNLQTVVLKAKSDVKWSVKFLKIKEKYYFMDGWLKFMKDNLLQMGDLLVFSLLSPPPNSVFQVIFYAPKGCVKQPICSSSVFKEGKEQMARNRALESAKGCLKHKQPICSSVFKKGKQQMPRSRALESAKSFQSDNPFYSVSIKPTYLRQWGVYVPTRFLRRHLLSNDEKFVSCVLEVSDGRKWGPVECKDYKTCGRLSGRNWKKFCDDNQLGVGDACVLELMDEMKKVLKVTIFRA